MKTSQRLQFFQRVYMLRLWRHHQINRLTSHAYSLGGFYRGTSHTEPSGIHQWLSGAMWSHLMWSRSHELEVSCQRYFTRIRLSWRREAAARVSHKVVTTQFCFSLKKPEAILTGSLLFLVFFSNILFAAAWMWRTFLCKLCWRKQLLSQISCGVWQIVNIS